MFEKLLYRHLQSCEDLKPYLAVYGGTMAIFNQIAPPDTAEEWEGSQYGRIVFMAKTEDSPEREKRGTLIIDIQCKDGEQIPEEILSVTIPLIDGYFFSTEKETIAVQWQSSDYFTAPTEKINGVTITFSLLAFPTQTTTQPDPVQAINEFSKEALNIKVIGYDTLNSVFKPSTESPAIYWRITNISKCGHMPDTFQTKYRTAMLQGHIFTPNFEQANAISRDLDNAIAFKKSLKFPNGTYMRMDWDTKINNTVDPLSTGQITVETSYAVLAQKEAETIKNIQIKDVSERGL